MSGNLFKPVVVGLLVLLFASAEYFVYAAYVTPRTRAAEELQALTDVLQLEQQKKPRPQTAENRGATIPDLLSRVQELAARTAITLAAAEPSPSDPEQFRLILSGHYVNVLQFIAGFQTLQVEVVGFDMAPAMEDPHSVTASVTFNHTSGQSPVQTEAVKAFEKRLRTAALRDPFDPTAAMIQLAGTDDTDDLTWTYHLTSISQVGNKRYATIDGRDYSVGDRLHEFMISGIAGDRVTLVEHEGGKEMERTLKFRVRRGART